MTDRPGKRMGQQGREEIAALSDEELHLLASEHDVNIADADGNPVDRDALVAEVANKVRAAERHETEDTTEVTPGEETPAEG